MALLLIQLLVGNNFTYPTLCVTEPLFDKVKVMGHGDETEGIVDGFVYEGAVHPHLCKSRIIEASTELITLNL